MNFKGEAQYHQAGLVLYGNDDNFTKFGRIATNAAGSALAEKFEFIYENAGTPRNDAADSTANLPGTFPDDYWMRMKSDGTQRDRRVLDRTGRTGSRSAAPRRCRRTPRSAFSRSATPRRPQPVAAFDSFRSGAGGAGGPSFDDEFDGASLDKKRWNAIVRDTPSEYAVSGGQLTITNSPGDIYTGDTTPPPNNFILQDASHAGTGLDDRDEDLAARSTAATARAA